MNIWRRCSCIKRWAVGGSSSRVLLCRRVVLLQTQKNLSEKSKGEPDHFGLALRCAFSLRRIYFAVVIAMRICSLPSWFLASSLSSAVAFGTW